MLDHLKCGLRMEQRLTVEQCYQLIQLAEAIVDYGGMLQTHYGSCVPDPVIEVSELAYRFREAPKAINDALVLLKFEGRAEPVHPSGCWRLQLTDILPSAKRRSAGVLGL